MLLLLLFLLLLRVRDGSRPRERYSILRRICMYGKGGRETRKEPRWTKDGRRSNPRSRSVRGDVHGYGYVVHGADQASFRVIRSDNNEPPSTLETTTIHARDFLVYYYHYYHHYLLPRSNAIQHGSPLFVIQRRRFHFDVIDARYDPQRLCHIEGKG